MAFFSFLVFRCATAVFRQLAYTAACAFRRCVCGLSRFPRCSKAGARATARISSAPQPAYSARNCANRNERSPVLTHFSWATKQTLGLKPRSGCQYAIQAKKKQKKKASFRHRPKRVSASYDVVLSHSSYPRIRRRRLLG